MDVSDSMLMSYVDGELSAQQQAELDASIACSSELSARVAALRASCLPYQAAFDARFNMPVPETLARRVGDLVMAANTRHARTEHWRVGPQWLAAAFFVGVISAGALLQPNLGGPPFHSALAPWVQAASEYQDLYVRKTIALVDEDRALTTRVLSDIRNNDGMAVRIPDLSAEGLTFKRVQRLSYRNAALIQMVYMPDRGEPVALCAMAEAGKDEGVRTYKIGEMQIATWRRHNLTYALLSKDGNPRQIAERIARETIPDLYGNPPTNKQVPQS